ncbi:ankyrin repeat-containing domain protein [Aspergillus pseudoustus]|uniref:Ankyrin repeat-containing domain protein n=1 Tax=Aspergillus pseudoustus TaxID=1810923 RepID=A0ABR4IGR1_9EURO
MPPRKRLPILHKENTRQKTRARKLFLSLPNEIFFMVASYLESDHDLNAFSRKCKRFHPPISPILYRNSIQNHSSSGLFWAAKTGRASAVELFLRYGADVNLRNGSYLPPLRRTSTDQESQHWPSASPPTIYEAVSQGNLEMTHLLLDFGANPNQEGGWSGNALQSAIWEGHSNLLPLLLDHGADPHASGSYDSALVAAAAKGNLEVANILLQRGVRINEDKGSGTALRAAAYRGNSRMVHLLLDWGTHGSPYRAARARGHTRTASLLLMNGASPRLGEDLDFPDGDDYTLGWGF